MVRAVASATRTGGARRSRARMKSDPPASGSDRASPTPRCPLAPVSDTLQGSATWCDERVLPDGVCRVSGGGRGLRGTPGDGRGRALSQRHREAREKRRKILLDAARPVLAYVACAGIAGDVEGPLFRPLRPDGSGFECRHLDRKTPWRLVKKYCHAVTSTPTAWGCGIGMYTLRKTAINDAIRNGASLHALREFAGHFAGHADIRTTELYFVGKEEDGEVAARRIQMRVTGQKGE